MSGPWEDYGGTPAEDGPWADYATAPAKPKRTSQALGFYKGAMKPLDNAAMALEAGAKRLGVPTDKINNLFAAPSAAQATDQRAAAIARSPNRPGMVGEVAGNIFGTIPAAMVTKNPAIGGGLSGALLTDKRTAGGVVGDAVMGAGLGYAGGTVIDAIGDVVKPAIAPAVRRLSDAGVRLTPGMIRGGKVMAREDKMMSRPRVGDTIAAARGKTLETFNTATVNEALKPLGVQIPGNLRPGHESIAYAKQTLRDAYDDVIPKMAVKIDGRAFAGKLAPSAGSLEAPQRKQLQSLLNQHLKNGDLSGQALKNAHGELRRLASSYGRDQSAANRELGKVLYEAADDLMGAMTTQNPALAPRLAKVNEAYRGYKIAAGAAKGADDGIFSTAQLKQSVLRGDRTKDKDAAAQGAAFMQRFSNDARDVIPAKTLDSGTAGRQQAANIFANVRGAADDLGYRASDAYQRLRLAPRPTGAARVAEGVKRLKAPATAAAIAASHQRGD